MTELASHPNKQASEITQPLAVTLPLSGQHLIEASAGTGKTWTLTGIVLRLLIEAGYACDNIIASTFTRSASAEMRERIRGRLQDMEKLLKACQQALARLATTLTSDGDVEDAADAFEVAMDALHFTSINRATAENLAQQQAINQQQFEQFMAILQDVVRRQGLSEAFNDPVNQHVIKWLAYHEFNCLTDIMPSPNESIEPLLPQQTPESSNQPPMPLAEAAATVTSTSMLIPARPQKTLDFRVGLSRTTTALNQLDRLFVGTLDSLCQKWLREFSADTGYQPSVQISNNVENIILAMIHDQLRAFRATVSEHEPAVFELMYASNRLPKADDFLPAVTTALNFYSTPIDTFVPEAFDLLPLEELLLAIREADSEALQPYTEAEFRLRQGMGKKALLNSRFVDGLTVQQQLEQQGILGLLQLSERQKEWLASVQELLTTGKGFNKGFTKQQEQFTAIPLIQLYAQLYTASQALIQHMEALNQYFHRFICQYVREQLPVVLEAQQITTFSLQLARLNQALASKQGASLARYIRHQYPVALIDESQDINTEQAMLIQRIYLPSNKNNSLSKNTSAILEKNKTTSKNANPTNNNPTNSRQFLLLVGDPKQAIYGFRGGDVSNYTQLKAQFTTKPQELTENRRSAPAIIAGLNHWFGKPNDPSQQDETVAGAAENTQAYYLGEQIHYRFIKASRDNTDLFIKVGDGEAVTYQPAEQAIFLLKLAHGQTVPSLSDNDKDSDITDKANPKTPDATHERSMDFNAGVVALILSLFDPNADKPLFYQDEQTGIRPLRLRDIGILADKNKQLDSLENALNQQGISTSRGGSQSLFAGEMTQDLIALMQAMLYPYDITRLRRLLLSHFFELSLLQVTQLYAQHEIDEGKAEVGFTSIVAIQQMITEAGRLWQKLGFLTAIQWLLHQTVTIQGVCLNFWQRLAQQALGERLLIDLRQLLDIISQLKGAGKDLGEHQLLAWLEQQQAQQPKEEWSIQQRLPSEDGVQLMTIHNSKGLEFPIVFVVGLDKKINARSQTYQLYRYTDNKATGLQNRRLSPVPYHKGEDEILPEYYKTIEHKALYEEKLRLAYVALTRCRDRLYIVAQSSKNNESDVPLKHWLQGKTFELPEHLTPYITQIDINSLSKYFNPNTNYQNNLKNNPHQITMANKTDDNTLILDYPNWQANIQHTQFIGWSNTSFTALSRHLQHDKQDVAINQPDYLFESNDRDDGVVAEIDYINDEIHNAMADLDKPLVRFTFEKGTNAGTFLHKILENLPLLQSQTLDDKGQLSPTTLRQWTPMIDRAVKTYQISSTYLSDYNQAAVADDSLWVATDAYLTQAQAEQAISPDHLALATWLYEIMHTPLLASATAVASPITLADIPPKQKITELSFDMSLRQDFSLQAVNQLFNSVGIQLNLNTQAQVANYWRYLRGEIDLIYQAGERFFIVDYKSNHLGNQFARYDEATMRQTMDEHGYWLQAAIYQVALHRYLTLRLPNYRITQHLGAVEYAFLRGMSPDYPEQGRLVWQPSVAFIEAFDDILGKAGQD